MDQPMKILVVDDSRMIRRTIRKELEAGRFHQQTLCRGRHPFRRKQGLETGGKSSLTGADARDVV